MRWFVLVCLILLLSCKKEPNPVDTTVPLTPYAFSYPNYVPQITIPENNPTTIEGVALGRKLYYDTMLSEGGPLEGKACASCHQQAFGFSTPSVDNPPVIPHVNLAWNHAFLWNGAKEGTLEDVMLFEVVEFFQADPSLFHQDMAYREMAERVFGSPELTHEQMAKAMAQFVRTVMSFDAKVDRFLQGKDFLSDAESRGYLIFNSEKGDCFHCHSMGLFTDGQFHNNGLEANPTGIHEGRYGVTGHEMDRGKFKTPTLRNVALRGPYMHDGRFNTLEEVVEFYNAGVQFSATLDPIMTKPGKNQGLNLTQQDKDDLVAFLYALTDTAFTINPALSAP